MDKNCIDVTMNFLHCILCILICFTLFFTLLSRKYSTGTSLAEKQRRTWEAHKKYTHKLFTAHQNCFCRKKCLNKEWNVLETMQCKLCKMFKYGLSTLCMWTRLSPFFAVFSGQQVLSQFWLKRESFEQRLKRFRNDSFGNSMVQWFILCYRYI